MYVFFFNLNMHFKVAATSSPEKNGTSTFKFSQRISAFNRKNTFLSFYL